MKKVIFAAALGLFVFAGAGCNCCGNNNKQLFTVNADAIVNVAPDKVVINVGVISKGTNLAETRKRNAAIITKAIAYAKSIGVAEKDIESSKRKMRASAP